MPGKSQQTQTQQSQSSPWAPAQPLLTNILSGISGQLSNSSPTSVENQALQSLTQNAQGLPNFAPQATNLANNFIGGDPSGLLSPALKQYQNTLNPIANASLDPMQTPGIQSLLDTIRSDVSNSVNGQFAGAGRDMSGLNQQALARGIAQGEAQPLLNQYNQNVSNVTGAANGLLGASNNTASAMAGNQAQGLNFASAVPSFATAQPSAVLAAQQAARALPLQNLGMLENLTVPIAGLGGQSNGTATASVSANPFQTALGGILGVGGLLGRFV